jgi:hypothetical protein
VDCHLQAMPFAIAVLSIGHGKLTARLASQSCQQLSVVYTLTLRMSSKLPGAGQAEETIEPFRPRYPFDTPEAPLNVRASEIFANSVTLEWDKPSSDGGSKVSSYIVEKRFLGGAASAFNWSMTTRTTTETRVVIEQLVEETEYEFRVGAENLAGIGRYSSGLSLTTRNPWTAPIKIRRPAVKVLQPS